MAVYAAQLALWAAASAPGGAPAAQAAARRASGAFLAAVSAAAAAGFLVYGGRLFLMLRRFPIESRGRRRKLREVGAVTSICAACFLFRAGVAAWAAFDQEDAGLDVLGHEALNCAYYVGAEVLPSALVLAVLRKLPPRRAAPAPPAAPATAGYAPLPDSEQPAE